MTTVSTSRDRKGTAQERTCVEYYPRVDDDLRPVEIPVTEVTLLEDRAQVRRCGRVTLDPGRSRVMIKGAAPVLQDVSLRGAVAGGDARVVDLRVRRAVRVRAADKPELARELEEEIARLRQRFEDVTEDRQRAEQRYGVLLEMLAKSVIEIPEDAAWGLVNHQVWHDTFEALYRRTRKLVEHSVEHYFTQLDLAEEVGHLATRRLVLDRRDMDFVTWIEADLDAAAAGEVELSVEYVVPNALWRPLHSARLSAGKLRFRSNAAVWQNTGEDWRDARLVFSTARASLGTEPPFLSNDCLQARRKSDRVVVQQRQVEIQTAGLGRGGTDPGGRPSNIELPGVDDGGEIQNLRSGGPSTVESDGRLNVIPLFDFEADVAVKLVCAPELEQKVFVNATLTNPQKKPILAGPVELIREGGVVGWTRVLYIAPGEVFELSFGHEDSLRVYRTQQQESDVDPVDRWTHHDTVVSLFVSNLEDERRRLEVIERIPVSEIEQVRVALKEDGCKPTRPEVDKDGMCRWDVDIPAGGQTTLRLEWRLSSAPDVEGL